MDTFVDRLTLRRDRPWNRVVENVAGDGVTLLPWPDKNYLCEFRDAPGGTELAPVTVDTTNRLAGYLSLQIALGDVQAITAGVAAGVVDITTDLGEEIMPTIIVQILPNVTEVP